MHRFPHRSQVSSIVELRARQMRSALTPSEAKLWAAIRGGRLGVSFRRQVPLGNYIADFAAPAAKLVVEVDDRTARGVEDRIAPAGDRAHAAPRDKVVEVHAHAPPAAPTDAS